MLPSDLPELHFLETIWVPSTLEEQESEASPLESILKVFEWSVIRGSLHCRCFYGKPNRISWLKGVTHNATGGGVRLPWHRSFEMILYLGHPQRSPGRVTKPKQFSRNWGYWPKYLVSRRTPWNRTGVMLLLATWHTVFLSLGPSFRGSPPKSQLFLSSSPSVRCMIFQRAFYISRLSASVTWREPPSNNRHSNQQHVCLWKLSKHSCFRFPPRDITLDS